MLKHRSAVPLIGFFAVALLSYAAIRSTSMPAPPRPRRAVEIGARTEGDRGAVEALAARQVAESDASVRAALGQSRLAREK